MKKGVVAMKVAVMTDVHGNLPALEAALEIIKSEECDCIYHTGDAVGIGPFPLECLEMLLENKVRMLMGNHEEYYAFGVPVPKPPYMSKGELEHQLWVSSVLGESYKELVAAFPYKLTECFHNHTVVFSHYPQRSGKCGFLEVEESLDKVLLDRMFTEDTADLVFYGHNHFSLDVTGRARYVNPGPLGCSADTAVARFVIVDFHYYSYELKHFCIPYNAEGLFEAFEERQVPERSFLREAFFSRIGDRN